MATTSVAVGVAITLVSPPGTASAAAAPRNPAPNGAVNQPARPNVPDANTKNPSPPQNSAPGNPGASNSAPSNSGVGQAPSSPSPAPKPQRKDKPPDRDAHKFSPTKRTPAGQSSQRGNNKNDNNKQEPAPAPAWVPMPAPAPVPAPAPAPAPAAKPAPAPAPGAGQGISPQAALAGFLNGVNNSVNNVLASANDTLNRVVSQVPAPLQAPRAPQPEPQPGLTVVKAPKAPKPARKPGFETQEYHPAEEGAGTQFEDFDFFERPPHIIGMPERDLTAEVPGYEIQEQQSVTDAYPDGWVYFCGPASAQNTLAILGIDMSQDELAAVLGTTENGTDTIDQVKEGLNSVLAENGETPVYDTASVEGGEEIHPVTGKAAATEDEIKQVRSDVRWSISKGYPVVVNVTDTAPGVTINGQPHSYAGHYVTVVGYNKETDTVKIADSAYAPRYNENGTQVGWQSGTYDMKTEDLAHWSAGKGYTYAKGYPAPGT